MDREIIINSFMKKLSNAKNQNVREVRFSINEMEGLAFVITELLGHFYNKIETFQDSLKPGEVKVVPFSNEEIKMDGGSFE